AKEPISLETPIGEEEDSHLGDFIEDKSITSPSEAVISVNLAEQNRKVLATLTPREEKVLRMRFGIGEKSDHTLEAAEGVRRELSVRLAALAVALAAACGHPHALADAATGDATSADVAIAIDAAGFDAGLTPCTKPANKALSFAGNQWVTIADAASLQPTDLTIELWAQFSTIPGYTVM